MDTRQRLQEVITRRCILKGDFVLASGARSSVYFDCKRATLDPEGLALIGELLWQEIQALPEPVTAVVKPAAKA